MEALDGPNRKSEILSIINHESLDRINTDRSYTSAPTMAATAVVSPAPSMYSNGPPPPYSGWSAPSSHPASDLISPPESRRTSDNKTESPFIQTAPPHRQSLPSIHEALGPKPNGPYLSPVSTSLPPQHQIPYPQSQTVAPPRSYPPSDHAPYPTQAGSTQPRQPSPPQPVHPQSNPFTRPEPAAKTYSDVPRHQSLTSLQTAPTPAPHNPYAAVPRYEPPRFEQDPRAPERLTNGYTHHPPPQQHSSYVYGPGPNHAPGPHTPAYNHPRYPPRDGREIDEVYKGGREAERFKQGLKRNLEVWDFENYLSSINVSSGALQDWSNHFHSIAQEQQPRDPNGVPDRMPTLESCNEMLQHQDKIRLFLEKLRDMISQQHEHVAMMDQRMREHGGKGSAYYDDEMSLYGDDLKNQGYGGPESKKRRGRAAPPGRCHSCNRAETPEWRRGPDGARTLCNACGLHYAKLTRKNTMKQSQSSNGSSLRPKSIDDISPRPL